MPPRTLHHIHPDAANACATGCPSCGHHHRHRHGHTDLTIALAGNPNVGKSSLFNRLTGANAETANYPGKTVALNFGESKFGDKRIGVIDLPGTYALGAQSEDQQVARQAVLENPPDAIVAIADATNLERNLYLILQYLDLGLPLVLAVNLVDEAARAGITIDAACLARALGVPVVPTIATRGNGVHELMDAAARVRVPTNGPAYDIEIETAIDALARTIRTTLSETPYRLTPRALAILLLEQDAELTRAVERLPRGADVVTHARALSAAIEARVGEPLSLHLPRARHALAQIIARDAQSQCDAREPLSAKLWRWSIQPLTGIPTLLALLIALFAFLFWVGGALAEAFAEFWGAFVSPPIQMIVGAILGESIVAKIALWGFDAGIAAALEIGIPYVLTFYALLALLEDSGYMNSIAFLLDALMKRLGLHGRAVILLLAGAGCNVPAIMGTRVLTTRRERIIASTLIVLTPCSARTAVIAGGAALFAGWQYGAAILLITLAVIILVGVGLARLMPGRSDDLVMEMFPFRVPTLNVVARKTWFRFREFILTALPIVLIGSLVMGALYETGVIWIFSAPLAPIVEGWLGLPAVAGLTLIFATLRKELALQFLLTLALVQYGSGADNVLAFMTPHQIFVYALVNTLYIPCLATFAVLQKELGARAAVGIAGFTIALAVVVGGIARYVLTML
ncbi:MAG: ferrous iron transport protein B [Chloroflexi bacterium]|nr:ferrous iron transport protein B [Chloroflexota bacterium]